ncbi:MAG: trypsin-like peptidase domain-containing protein [Anaerolineae bacterium]|nr:trypsin-like peptidase domain-containing protein [Anaerolineae bacterium]
MNVRFVIRGFLLALPLVLLIGAGWVWLQTPWSRLPDATPPPPTIYTLAGVVPASPVGQRALARYGQGAFHPVGSGFFLQLDTGQTVALTAAHTVTLGNRALPVTAIAFTTATSGETVAEFDRLLGKPGRRLTPSNLSIDYLLLVVDQAIDPALVLTPDPRGGPQPGERVLLYSGLGDGAGGMHRLAGTVQSSDRQAVWVLMDKQFDPGQMSGSPLVSQHTGHAVAMVVASSPRRGALLIGGHPIGSLVARAAEADTQYTLSEWSEDLR